MQIQRYWVTCASRSLTQKPSNAQFQELQAEFRGSEHWETPTPHCLTVDCNAEHRPGFHLNVNEM